MTTKLTLPPNGADHNSTVFQTWYFLVTTYINQLLDSVGTGGEWTGNLDGGNVDSVYGGTTGIDGGGV